MKKVFIRASNFSKRLTSATNRAFSVQHACGLSTTPSMRMRLRMLKYCVGKGRHVMKPLHVHVCLIMLQYYAIVPTGRAGYVLYRALVPASHCLYVIVCQCGCCVVVVLLCGGLFLHSLSPDTVLPNYN